MDCSIPSKNATVATNHSLKMKKSLIHTIFVLLIFGSAFAWVWHETAKEKEQEKLRQEHYEAEAKRAARTLNLLDLQILAGEKDGWADLDAIRGNIDLIAGILNDPSSGVDSSTLGQPRIKSKIPWLSFYRLRAKRIEAIMEFRELRGLSEEDGRLPSDIKHAQELGAFINGVNKELERAEYPNYVGDAKMVAALIKRVKDPSRPIVRSDGSGIE